MADIKKCQDELMKLAKSKGYLTFDDIIHASDAFSLSVLDVDRLSEAIQLLGVIVYEESPIEGQVSRDIEDLSDYSRTDYDRIFSEVLRRAPQMEYFIDKVRELPAPQWGEVSLLAKQSKEGNQFARERIIKIYIRSVLKVALSMSKHYELDLEETISTGFIGLIFAVDRYNPDGFSAFHSYASLWIQQVIQRFCNPKWFDYYFPVHVKEKMLRALKKYEMYTTGEDYGSAEHERVIEKVAEELELSEQEVKTLIRYSTIQKQGKLSWDSLIETESKDYTSLPDEFLCPEESLIDEVYQNELKEAVDEALSGLKPREREVITMRNGLGGNPTMTLEEVGQRQDVTRERIRQIEKKAFIRLKKSKKLREYWNEGKVNSHPRKKGMEELMRYEEAPAESKQRAKKRKEQIPTYWNAKEKRWVPY